MSPSDHPPQIPQICLCRPALAIQSSALRPFLSPTDLYQAAGCNSKSVGKAPLSPVLFRRHINTAVVPRAGRTGPSHHDPDSPGSCFFCEQGKEPIDTVYQINSPRSGDRHLIISGLPATGKKRQHKGNGRTGQVPRLSSLATTLPHIREDDILPSYSPLGSVAFTGSTMAPSTQPEGRPEQFKGQNQSTQAASSLSILVDVGSHDGGVFKILPDRC